MRRLAFVCSLLGSLTLAGCALDDPPPPAEPVAITESPIINGTIDNVHDAVVALFSQTSECSGTIVQVKGTTGYVLTAAHCCTAGDKPVEVDIGVDFNNPTKVHQVIAASVTADPNYNPNTSAHDFCMLQFSGATAATPVIPVATPPDGVAVGTVVDFVGYGIIGDPVPNPNNPAIQNNMRRHKTGPIAQLDSLLLQYNESAGGQYAINGGPCEGDSGGPALTTSGPLKVVGVTSSGDAHCAQFGISGRVSGVSGANQFITNYLAGQPIVPVMDCNTCYTDATSAGGSCYASVQACLNDAACKALVQCLNACPQNNQACVDNCASAHQAGISKYNAINTCVCTTGCPALCGNDPACMSNAPPCGLGSNDPSCEACVESKCCTEAKDCAGDQACVDCLVQNPPASCNNNAHFTGLFACLDGKCGAECGGSASSSSSSSSSASSASSSGGGAGGAGGVGGAGGAGGSGAGESSGNGGNSGNKDPGSDATCSAAPGRDGAPVAPLAGLVLAALAALPRRRRKA